jgi:hypothetical protein
MFVATILFNGTKSKSAELLAFIYICDCSHMWTHDDLSMVHEVDLQHNIDRNIMLLVDIPPMYAITHKMDPCTLITPCSALLPHSFGIGKGM